MIVKTANLDNRCFGAWTAWGMEVGFGLVLKATSWELLSTEELVLFVIIHLYS
jgi:hypothetical protein